MPKRDPHRDAHLEWIGFVRPTGLVVSAPALVRAGAILPRDPEGQRLLRACVTERRFHPEREPEPWLPDFRAFASSVLGWNFSPKGYAGTAEYPIPPELETPLQEGGEVLRPDFAVRERDPRDNASAWQLVVKVVEPGDDFDRVAGGAGRLEVSAHGRMERLLRQTGVPAGLLCNGRSLRLVSAPRGESSGWLDVHVADMVTTAGRPIVAALRLLLSQTRLLSLPRDKRFAALLADSRRFQNEVSERLAEQVLHALYELLRGIQAADDTSKGRTAARAAGRAARRHLPRPPHRHPAPRLPALRGGAGPAARRRDVRAPLLPRRPVRAPARGRGAAPRHAEPALRRLGAASRAVPAVPRRRRGGRSAPAQTPRRVVRPRPLPVSRRPWQGRGAPDPRTDRATARARRHPLPRARQAASARRRAHLVPRPRRGADRFGLRDDDGLPARNRPRPVGGHQGAEEARRADRRRPRSAGRRAGRTPGAVAAGADRPRAHRYGPQAGGPGRDRRRPARRPAARDRHRRHARPRAARRPGAAAERGAPPLRIPLHTARTDRADRPHHAGADPHPAPRPRRKAAQAGGDS